MYDINKEMVNMKEKGFIPLFSSLMILYVLIVFWIYEIKRGKIPFVDEWTGKYVESFANTFIYDSFWTVTHLGSKAFLIPFTVIVALVLWVLCKDWLVALFFSGGTLISHLLNMLIKNIVARERPGISIEANAEGFSFPSGHSMITMVCYGLLMYFLIRTVESKRVSLLIQVAFALLIFLIGTSRYIINVHFATDIIAGFTIGFTLLILFIYLFEAIHRKRSIHKNQT